MPTVEICRVRKITTDQEGIYRLRLEAPAIASSVRPGQFVHLRLPELEAHMLRRPLSVFDADPQNGTVDLLFQVIGEGTRHLSTLEPGTRIDAIGPLGSGWNPPQDLGNVLLVAGGVGLAPLNMLARNLCTRSEVFLVVGAQTGERLVLPSFKDWHLTVAQTTDDGSVGSRGFVTDLARGLLEKTRFGYIATCGPEPMQRIVASLAREFGVPCEVSLERRMACGIGACLSCVVQTTGGQKRACIDGPVFDAGEVVW
jgi:dihydroorotate dehydrogenase electron transfer subunit